MPVKPNNQRPDRGRNRKAGNDTKVVQDKQSILAKELGLRPKSKQVLDALIADPKLSQTEAYIQVHKTTNRNTAKANASKLLTSTNAKIYNDSAIGKAKRRIVGLIDSDNENIALKASSDVLDRTEGKAIQKNETTHKLIEVKLDLSGARLGAHYIKADTLPIPE